MERSFDSSTDVGWGVLINKDEIIRQEVESATRALLRQSITAGFIDEDG